MFRVSAPFRDYLFVPLPLHIRWDIHFGGEGGLGTQHVRVDHTRLIVGLANAWASPLPGDKFLLILPGDCLAAYRELQSERQAPLGFMYWNAADEGAVVKGSEPERRLRLAQELNDGGLCVRTDGCITQLEAPRPGVEMA